MWKKSQRNTQKTKDQWHEREGNSLLQFYSFSYGGLSLLLFLTDGFDQPLEPQFLRAIAFSSNRTDEFIQILLNTVPLPDAE